MRAHLGPAGVVLTGSAGTVARAVSEVEILVDGDRVAVPLEMAAADETARALVVVWRAATGAAQPGATLTDAWRQGDEGLVLERRLHVDGAPAGSGVRASLRVVADVPSVRIVAPGMVYSPDQHQDGVRRGFADDRLAYPAVAWWDPATSVVLGLARQTVARYDSAPDRVRGQHAYLQRTDVGSAGFLWQPQRVELEAGWPYAEEERSAMLDAAGSPAVAFHPVDGELDVVLRYRVVETSATTFSGAVTALLGAVCPPEQVQPTPPRVDLRESIALRLDSAARTWATVEGFSGFRLNFDPQRGYESQPRAFGASFTDHAMGRSHDILEYGFTGRQLNLAAMLAERDPEAWAERSAAVVESFVARMTRPSGWVHTLWDLRAGEPVFACGDPSGPVMHYLGRSAAPGTYTRMMCEAGEDLCRCVAVHERLGRDVSAWRAAAHALGRFLVRAQDEHGAWMRAYTPEGEPIVDGEWFGGGSHASRTATATVVPFLLAVARDTGTGEPERDALLRAATRACEYVLARHVAADDYRGGTLDNPNVVDKEAAFYAMRALWALHQVDDDERWLTGALRAAEVAASWHSLWEVPLRDGTPVGTARVRSVGWGGINSTWGVGVTDVYSLFFAGDLHRLGRAAGRPDLCAVARLVATSSVQLLSHPGESYGFADAGMQPEGIAFCSQGEDEGLIAKGDLWGGLGWPYTAGTAGLDDYLAALDETPDDHADDHADEDQNEHEH